MAHLEWSTVDCRVDWTDPAQQPHILGGERAEDPGRRRAVKIAGRNFPGILHLLLSNADKTHYVSYCPPF